VPLGLVFSLELAASCSNSLEGLLPSFTAACGTARSNPGATKGDVLPVSRLPPEPGMFQLRWFVGAEPG
jgi:hypothetical protein